MRTEAEIRAKVLQLRFAKKEPIYTKYWKEKAAHWIEAFDWVLNEGP